MLHISASSPSPRNSNTIVLTALRPQLECCHDTNDFGTLVLRGRRFKNNCNSNNRYAHSNDPSGLLEAYQQKLPAVATKGGLEEDNQTVANVMMVDLESLSTLQPANTHAHDHDIMVAADDDTDDEWNRVPIWNKSPWKMITAEQLGSLKQRLNDILTNSAKERRQSRSDQLGKEEHEYHIQAFLRDSSLVFECVIQTLNAHSNNNKDSTETADSLHWTVDNILELHRQLEDLEFECATRTTPMTASTSMLAEPVVEPILDLSENLSTVTLQCRDGGNRHFTMALNLSAFPQHISIDRWDLPKVEDADTSSTDDILRHKPRAKRGNSSPETIRDLYLMFVATTDAYQNLWNELDDLDANVWVLEANTNNRSVCHRSIYLSNSAKLIVSLDRTQPRTRPTKVQFLGSHGSVYYEMFQSYSWDEERSVRHNLETCFGKSLARPTNDEEDSNTMMNATTTTFDCGICFGSTKETSTLDGDECCDCENPKCARPFHNACLEKWLTSLPTSRISFDTMIGSCPYCKDPIAVQMSDS
ncbi:FANCL C-terminal domain [Fragilaria crotonensis]|nr:FANCL C-terminal domain [Fragilaria crotonensis]